MTPYSAFNITQRVSEYLRPEYEVIMEWIRHAKIVNVDETSEKVDGVNHWLWVFTTQTDTFLRYERAGARGCLMRF
jgi:transposase